jgi:P-type E1-E2 ATPase
MINGPSLALIFANEDMSQQMRSLFRKASSVIVYRSSPNDKAEVVKFVMSGKEDVFTLAVGDGGNDVNMIQTASIGVGIMGKEGNQAAQFSDYSIANFQSLNRLVFHHGLPFGHRIIIFIFINLTKGAVYIMGVWAANMQTGYSALPLVKEFYYALPAVTMTTITSATLAAFD